jgi:hypothetical protein
MATLFPLDPEINDLYQGYYWDGNVWKRSGEDAGFGYLEESALQNTYLSQSSASTTYLTQASGLTQASASTTYLDKTSASNTYATKSLPILTDASLTGTSKIEQALETVTISASVATGTINYDVLDNHGITYYTSAATGNWTLNVRGNSGTTLNSIMSIGQALTIVFINTTTTTAYYQTGFQIDGSSVIPEWQGGTAPSSGNANSNDIYTFTIIKTANATYTVLGSQVRFA